MEEDVKTSYAWDGDKIKQTTTVKEMKFSPKDMLNSLDHVRSQIGQMNNDLVNLEKQRANLNDSLESAKKFESERKEFESKCEELQRETLKGIIALHGDELAKEAKSKADEEIAKNPTLYDEGQKSRMAYLNYQRALGTHPKVAEKICNRIIKKDLFDKPIFDDPFKG